MRAHDDLERGARSSMRLRRDRFAEETRCPLLGDCFLPDFGSHHFSIITGSRMMRFSGDNFV